MNLYFSVSEYNAFKEKIFRDNGSNYEEIHNALNHASEEIDRLERCVLFYYSICRPGDKGDFPRGEMLIVGITSLIEVMMGEVEYKDPFSYYESEFANEHEIKEYATFKQSYLNKYGATKKIVKYFEKYVPEIDAQEIMRHIKSSTDLKNETQCFHSVDQLAKFLYQMRSDFVHKAETRNFCPPGCCKTFILKEKKIYSIAVDTDRFLRIFEKSFVNFWREKYVTVIS